MTRTIALLGFAAAALGVAVGYEGHAQAQQQVVLKVYPTWEDCAANMEVEIAKQGFAGHTCACTLPATPQSILWCWA